MKETDGLLEEIKEIIQKNDLDQFKAKVDEGFNPHTTDFKDEKHSNMHALHLAVKYSANDIAKYLISNFYKNTVAINLNVIKPNGWAGSTTLHFAIENNLLEIVQLLTQAGASVDVSDDDNSPALVLAVQLEKIEIVKYLLSVSDIDVNVLCIWTKNILKEGKWIAEVTKKYSALWWACYKGYTKLVSLLCEKGAEVVFFSSFEAYSTGMGAYSGLSPLHVASKEGHVDIVKYFCESNYNCDKSKIIDAQDSKSNTPLHLAKNKEVARILIEVGQANIRIQNKKGISCVRELLRRDDKDLKSYLSILLSKDIQAKQSSTGSFSSYALLREGFTDYDKETQKKLHEIIKEESRFIRGIKEAQYKVMWIQGGRVLYGSHNANPEIRKQKTVEISVEEVHSHLKYYHDSFHEQYKSQSPKSSTNFICAAITIITSNQIYCKNGNHNRIYHTFIVSSNNAIHNCKKNNDDFLQGIINRLYASGSKTAKKGFIETLGQRNDLCWNEYTNDPTGHPFNLDYMHAEQSFLDYLSSEEAIATILEALKHENINAGFKIYGLGVHIHSTLSLCPNICKETILGFQNSKEDQAGFINRLTYQLNHQGYALPAKKNQLVVFTSFSASKSHCSLNNNTISFETLAIDINQSGPNPYLLQYDFNLAKKNELQHYKQLLPNQFTFFMSGSEEDRAAKLAHDECFKNLGNQAKNDQKENTIFAKKQKIS